MACPVVVAAGLSVAAADRAAGKRSGRFCRQGVGCPPECAVGADCRPSVPISIFSVVRTFCARRDAWGRANDGNVTVGLGGRTDARYVEKQGREGVKLNCFSTFSPLLSGCRMPFRVRTGVENGMRRFSGVRRFGRSVGRASVVFGKVGCSCAFRSHVSCLRRGRKTLPDGVPETVGGGRGAACRPPRPPTPAG